MNYYPYYTGIPYTTFSPVARGGLRSLFGGIKWSSILSGTQKTLGIVNQAIPIIKQAGPVINNAKTMFRVMNEFKKVDSPQPNVVNKIKNNQTNQTVKVEANNVTKQNGPVLFQ